MSAPLTILLDGSAASVTYDLACYGPGFSDAHSGAMREVLAAAMSGSAGGAPPPELLKVLLDASEVLSPTSAKAWRVARVASHGFGFSVTASSSVWARFSLTSVAGFPYTYFVDCAA
jgi:hypothetical protein